ncbi:FtsQ-type POTRA domain-containing protein [candidate division KSB1 bacterium]|nr:FtsQ-type POTRA domain-containing protein [candidate division KSB1 bacterium]
MIVVERIGKLFFVITTLMVVTLGTADWMRGKNAFSLRSIKVEGNQLISKENLLKKANIDSSKDLFELQPAEIEKRIKKEQPLVADVQVHRELPTTIRINVDEVDPIAKIAKENQWYGVDEDGNILAGLKSIELYDYPVITGLMLEQKSNNQVVLPEGFQDVLKCLKTQKKMNPLVLNQISEINYHSKSGLIFYLIDSGTPVIIGKDEIEKKLFKFNKVYPILVTELNMTQFVDLRYSTQIVVKKFQS